MVKKTVAAGAFKQTCLALLDDVATRQTQVIITKRGRPVARLVPMETAGEQEQSVLAALRGKGRLLVDEATFLAPSGEMAGWDAKALEDT